MLLQNMAHYASLDSAFEPLSIHWLPVLRLSSIYRPPVSSNLTTFFEELTKVLSKAVLKYENIILMGDFNIDFKNKGAGFDKLSEMSDTFNLTNLTKSETCYTKNHKPLIDCLSQINLNLSKKLMSPKLV